VKRRDPQKEKGPVVGRQKTSCKNHHRVGKRFLGRPYRVTGPQRGVGPKGKWRMSQT